MQPLIIEPKESTPYVNFNSETGIMEMKGVSFEEDSFAFYKPLLTWLDVYKQRPRPTTVLNVEFKYFNTATAKCLYDLLERFGEIKKKEGFDVVINWLYQKDDEQLKEEIQNFSEIAELPFNILEVD